MSFCEFVGSSGRSFLGSEVVGLVADSERKMLCTCVHCQPLNLEPQSGSLLIPLEDRHPVEQEERAPREKSARLPDRTSPPPLRRRRGCRRRRRFRHVSFLSKPSLPPSLPPSRVLTSSALIPSCVSLDVYIEVV